MKLTAGLCLALTAVIWALLGSEPWVDSKLAYHNTLGEAECCLEIAHAGGALNGRPYTNSLEALDENYAKGRRVFEIDFLETRDRKIVLAHDWNAFERPLARTEFLASDLGFTTLDLEALIRWLAECSECTIITDTKNDLRRFVSELQELSPDRMLEESFVLQTYSVNETVSVSDLLPDQRLIFTAYRSRRLETNDFRHLGSLHNLIAITIPVSRVSTLLPLIREAGTTVPVYVHGPPDIINRKDIHHRLMKLGISGFYLD